MIAFCAMSDAGGRKYNEDSIEVLVGEDRWCCILADGLGGMGGGAEASKAVVETLKRCFETGYMQKDTLQECCQRAHKAVKLKKVELGQKGRMFSTVVLVYGTEKSMAWVHCGDSRFYLFADGRLCAQTKDHSVPQMLAACGEIAPEEIRHHPDRNRLLSCLGIDEERAKVSPVSEAQITPGLVGLLCSDGFWEPVSEEQMLHGIQKEKDVQKWLKGLVKIIRKQPEKSDQDNYSAIGLWVCRSQETKKD